MTVMFVLAWVAVLVHNSIARRRWDPRVAKVRAEADAGPPASTSKEVAP
jgi:hypothetical protein